MRGGDCHRAFCSAGSRGGARRQATAEQNCGYEFQCHDLSGAKYGGNFWSRSYVTGDWGGLRSKLADHGVQFEFNVTQIYQGVASGGTNRTGRYSGSTDVVLKLDSQKLGLWPGGILLVEAQVPFGNTVTPYSGGILPVNTLLSMIEPAQNEIILPHLYLTQFLTEWMAVFIGKLDTSSGLPAIPMAAADPNGLDTICCRSIASLHEWKGDRRN